MKKANLFLSALLALVMLVGCPDATNNDNNTTGSSNGEGNFQGGGITLPNYPTWNVEVTSLTATPGDKSIRVTWREPNDNRLEAYYIGISDGNAIAWSEHGAGTSLKVYSNLENGREYTIKIITLGLDESDQDNPKWYMSSGVTVKATPTANADNTIYLPSLTNFSAQWDNSMGCVILSWTDIADTSDYMIEGYYFYASTSNTKPAQPNYDYEGIMANSSRVGYDTVSQESTELWLNDNSNPYKLAANTTYYIWALTTGTGNEDEFLYSKWSEMPMTTVTTGSVSDDDDDDDDGGWISEGG